MKQEKLWSGIAMVKFVRDILTVEHLELLQNGNMNGFADRLRRRYHDNQFLFIKKSFVFRT